MAFDYWHQRRTLRLEEATDEEVLPFGGPPFVIGNVVWFPEPVWRALVLTALDQGVPDVFTDWRWEAPLSIDSARELAKRLPTVSEVVAHSGVFVPPPDLSVDLQPDAEVVSNALRALQELASLAARNGRRIESWVE